MLGILPGGNIDAVFVKDRRRVDFTGTFGVGVFDGLAVFHFVLGRITVVLPYRFQKAAAALLDRLRVKRIAPAIATAEKHQLPAVDDARRSRTPLTVKNAFA